MTRRRRIRDGWDLLAAFAGWCWRHPLICLTVAVAAFAWWQWRSPGWSLASACLVPGARMVVVHRPWLWAAPFRRWRDRVRWYRMPTMLYAVDCQEPGCPPFMSYVGITTKARGEKRWDEHAEHQPWRASIVAFRWLAELPNRWLAETLEATLIREHNPRHNKEHNTIDLKWLVKSEPFRNRQGQWADPERRAEAWRARRALRWYRRLWLWSWLLLHPCAVARVAR